MRLQLEPLFNLWVRRNGSSPYRINRHLRKVAFAALSTLVYTEIFNEVVPKLENDEPLVPQPRSTEYRNFENVRDFGRALDGSAAAYGHAMEGMLRRGWEAVFKFIDENPDHPYSAIWECMQASQEGMKHHLGHLFFDARENCEINIADNIFVSLTLLTHLRLAYTKMCADSFSHPSAYSVTHMALRNADRISWGKTANAETIGAPAMADTLFQDIELLEACGRALLSPEITDHKNLIVPTDQAIYQFGYKHPTLLNEPWRAPRFCPGAPWLEHPTPEGRMIAQRFENCVTRFCKRYALRPPVFGEVVDQPTFFDRATALVN